MAEFTTSFDWKVARIDSIDYIRLDDLLLATVRHRAACKENCANTELVSFLSQFETLLQSTKDRLNEAT
jgi:hypothetical protein